MLNKLCKQAEKTFRRLVSDMTLGDSRIVDENPTYMKVHIEVIRQIHKSVVISIAHYFEQNGDLCCDPDMEFLVNSEGIFPLTFQQAIPPVYQVGAEVSDDGKVRWNERLQKDMTQFANSWMRNIEEQQFGE